ncbi:hypothetical protein Zmor_024666 [Zophobas morio]|uniref:SET domain-containing protein n=1 Tax=Zophobas morio TaxID=2755281 RepID=A0AA38I0P5_9CUCU|nr:hypothetical protein Zmor_024666 [Zophobas morio]
MDEIPEKVCDECGECRQPTVRGCEECGMRYCYKCKEQEHWTKCKNYEAKEGVCVKAARDLLPGETIFSECPLVLGPKLPPEDGQVHCVGCCRLVSTEKVLHCSDCAWPVCDPQCEDLKNPKTHGLECQVLKLAQTQNFRFEILFPLRILFLQTNNKPEWTSLIQLLSNKKSEDPNIHDLNTQNNHVEFLQDNFLVPLAKVEAETGTMILEEKSKELLEKIFDYVKTATFEAPNNSPMQLYYPTVPLIPHSCTPNSFQTTTEAPTYKITIRANSPISKNTPITSSYINLFEGTHERLFHLKTTKNALCSCPRCTDPTELGTFFSALKCLGTRTEPCGGTQLPLEPTSASTMWVCDKCKIELPNDQMVQFVRHLGGEVAKVLDRKPTADELEEFLAKLLMFLHPNHFYVCQVKQVLIKLYDGEDLAKTKGDICLSLVEIARKLYPCGGLLLVELLHGLFEARFSIMGKSEDLVKNEDVDELADLVKEMKSITEALFDPQLAQVVTQDASTFTDWLKNHH